MHGIRSRGYGFSKSPAGLADNLNAAQTAPHIVARCAVNICHDKHLCVFPPVEGFSQRGARMPIWGRRGCRREAVSYTRRYQQELDEGVQDGDTLVLPGCWRVKSHSTNRYPPGWRASGWGATAGDRTQADDSITPWRLSPCVGSRCWTLRIRTSPQPGPSCDGWRDWCAPGDRSIGGVVGLAGARGFGHAAACSAAGRARGGLCADRARGGGS